MMTLNNENPFQTTAKTSSLSPNLEFTILFYLASLSTYLPQKFLSKPFFSQQVWQEDTQYVQKFVFLNPLFSHI